MQWIDRNKLGTQLLAGTFLNLGSPTAVEIAADTGFDWLLIDLEHGSGSAADLRNMLLACRGSSAASIVRIRSVDADTVKFVMDSGAAGIMFPYVSTVAEAKRAVDCIKYPPLGSRGVAGAIRATNFGRDWNQYFNEANDNSLVIVQIETPEAVDASADIAAIDGVDVLFVGPLDLSVNLGCPGDFTQPRFVEALKKVVRSCSNHGRIPGILTKTGFEQQHKDLGFRFTAVGSDSLAVVQAMESNLATLRQ
ncbi:MAG: 2-dehydro-3-deoxyglucarate aldolase [Fuerstiella sp.]|nr:2-dehydro-3-deoxyglucarate aldolase [Fuerstiella sp.]MCP4785394.1 2-dehydro-3-deoxyglucarate aldolase [Fuerstiella sp.]MCP4858209.1 2-dehydro-3-deoxyglucarate aldolase [Fuerstiella sp.]